MIYVTRHGQTDWNVQKKVMGRCDEPLNETGLQQAEETRNNLLNTKIDIIICSPLQRAKQTADVINKGRNIPIIYDDRIVERDFGEFEGKQKILIFMDIGIIIKMSNIKEQKTYKVFLKEYMNF